ncbi:hypothetical protein QQ056_08210 [Oscillatoria laete-virens NRMC-F 0139]|nr:hypothetical protein [Oscillatoria laete-virens NRMC-F 0139]
MNIILLSIPLVIVAAFIVIWIFQLLWNSTLPDLFGWKIISFWTSFKLILIAAILFGGGIKLPFNYGESFTQTDSNGGTTTKTWSLGSQSK